MAVTTVLTDTSAYAVYATKAAFMDDLESIMEDEGRDKEHLRHLLYRLSNTDTDNWTAGSTVRHDA